MKTYISLLFINLGTLGFGVAFNNNNGIMFGTRQQQQQQQRQQQRSSLMAAVPIDDSIPCSDETPIEFIDVSDDVETQQVPKPILFYPGKFNRMIPQEFYGNFLSKLREHRKVYVANDSNVDNDAFIKDMTQTNGLCIVSHSTSANDVLELCKNIDDGFVDNLILIDPIDYIFFKNDFSLGKFDLVKMLESAEDFEENISAFIESNKFELLKNSLFSKGDGSKRKIKSKVLVLNTRMSKRWKIFPPIPPISKYSVNLKSIRNKVVQQIETYGHFDILDAPWANMIHNTISKGATSRDTDNIENYHTILVKLINDELDVNNDDVVVE
tara:strand:- start:121 stop:1098 length:978 start_codon:yes stop_codon:yes gene_type:complete